METDSELSFAVVHKQEIDKQAMVPIAEEAQRRGHSATITTDPNIQTDIALFANKHLIDSGHNAEITVRLPHGVDSYYPERGIEKKWNEFDIGLLFGPKSINNWYRCSHLPEARPKYGMYNVGWPKSDFLFKKEFQDNVDKMKKKLDLGSGKIIIYAPTSEDHGKVHDFVENSIGVGDELLIKHAPYENGEYMTDESIQDVYNKYREYDNIKILDKKIDIFIALSLADVLVSDRSSVLQESILTNTVPISVVDWPLRKKDGDERVNYKLPSFATETSQELLDETIKSIFDNFDERISDLNSCRDSHFSHLGKASPLAVDVIESIYFEQQPPIEAVDPKKSNVIANMFRESVKKVDENIPESIRKPLRKANIHKVYDKIVYGNK